MKQLKSVDMVFLEDLHMRGTDKHGQGHWHANRGKRKHSGIDLVVKAGSLLCSSVRGVVSKIGWTYNDPMKSACRYVQITLESGYKLRVHYVVPFVKVGDKVTYGKLLGAALDIEGRFYKGMLNHFHVGLRNRQGKRIDPTGFWLALGGSGESESR